MKNYDTINHVRGESLFIDDINIPDGTLFASVFYSPIAHGKITGLDLNEALSSDGVKRIITCKDIPGENQIGGIIFDEPLLAEEHVHFIGMPVALVIAENELTARNAVKKIKIEIERYPVITDPREAFKNGDLIVPPETFSCGNTDDAWNECDVIIEGECDSGGQEHLYLETQGAIAFPSEGGGLKIISSTQGPTTVQRVAAKVLALSMNKIEVEVLRLGGGFGGKEDQATPWAVMTALAAMKLNKPVKLILRRHDDMIMTGKRNPYSSDFKIGLKKDGKIIAYEASFYQNAGASADLSTAILDRTLFHCTNSYFIPNVKATGYCCKTNLAPNTAFRGFGGPQGKFVIECAIHKAAGSMGLLPSVIQKMNLLKEGDEFPYGQKAEHAQAISSWKAAEESFKPGEILDRINKFNSGNKFFKKGFAFMPICFGIAFTNTKMNQANALINIYSDGSVSFSTAAVEMGQGVNAKIREVVSRVFSVTQERIKNETTNTTRSANTSPTAASSGADLNCNAAYRACKEILDRLKNSALEELNESDFTKVEIRNETVYYDSIRTDLEWCDLIERTFHKRISLTAHAHYSTPEIFFDKSTNKGTPFRYHVYGTSITEVTVDCLRGIYKIDSVRAVHDFGESLNPVIDLGQAEGAIIQGLGWMTIEEVVHNKDGKLLSDLLSTYKVPDIHFSPGEMNIKFLGIPNPAGIFNSKAIGEPPLMYGIGAYFAIRNAVREFTGSNDFPYSAPITPEKVFMNLNLKKPVSQSS
ncbi:MAG TPA: molybdopterin-dependent oxidoreductase [Ignavibacteria bacterium]|nr:molybdopterin-dependent oxidoreductase [Ignavibacteria bacterium]HMR38925.1 molybdopterin-dependent oxidoreductase [Ignavibacteria bacterium]